MDDPASSDDLCGLNGHKQQYRKESVQKRQLSNFPCFYCSADRRGSPTVSSEMTLLSSSSRMRYQQLNDHGGGEGGSQVPRPSCELGNLTRREAITVDLKLDGCDGME